MGTTTATHLVWHMMRAKRGHMVMTVRSCQAETAAPQREGSHCRWAMAQYPVPFGPTRRDASGENECTKQRHTCAGAAC